MRPATNSYVGHLTPASWQPAWCHSLEEAVAGWKAGNQRGGLRLITVHGRAMTSQASRTLCQDHTKEHEYSRQCSTIKDSRRDL